MKAMLYQTNTKTLTRLGSDVASQAHRSIELLDAIESTIDALCYDQKMFDAFAQIAHQVLERVRQLKPIKPIDSDGAVADGFLKAQAATRDLYDLLLLKRDSAINDARLTEEDGVAEEYQRLIEIVKDLHDCLNDLRWAVGEHDADLCHAHGPVLTSAEDIEKLLA